MSFTPEQIAVMKFAERNRALVWIEWPGYALITTKRLAPMPRVYLDEYSPPPLALASPGVLSEATVTRVELRCAGLHMNGTMPGASMLWLYTTGDPDEDADAVVEEMMGIYRDHAFDPRDVVFRSMLQARLADWMIDDDDDDYTDDEGIEQMPVPAPAPWKGSVIAPESIAPLAPERACYSCGDPTRARTPSGIPRCSLCARVE